MTTVLVTGANGFVGSHFVEHILANTDWNIVAIINRHMNRIFDSKIYQQNKNRVSVIRIDLNILKYEDFKEELCDVEYIVNFAGLSHVDDSIKNPVSYITDNTKSTLSVLELARQIKPKKFIQFSTDEIYGPLLDGVLHKEWNSILPANPYSASKASQEASAIAYWRTYGVPLIITNTMTLFGERQGTERFVPKIVKALLEGQKIYIHTKNGVPSIRSYLHARNSADAILFILKNVDVAEYSSFSKPERFNIVADSYFNNYELAKYISEILDIDLDYEFVDMDSIRPGQDVSYGLDGDKLKSLGYKYPLSFNESMKNTVRWMTEKQNREYFL
jgi:dTDP-glucose 4,6-dehydratase